MSPQQQLTDLAQSIYLVIKNRFYDDIAGEDGQVYIQQVVSWVNMFLDELETTVDPATNELVDWWFTRESNYALGTASEGDASVSMPTAIDRLITDEMRYVQIQQDGITVSNWAVVHPKDITNKTDRITEDMCAQVGNNIVFSRAFRDTENNGSIVGDVSVKLPRMTFSLTSGTVVPTNIKVLPIVRPNLLLKLGVAKNATLPDIVQGVLSPSYNQKFNDLIAGAIARSKATSQASKAGRQEYGGVRGVY